MHGKNAITKSSQVIVSKTLIPPPVCNFYLFKEIYPDVCLSEIVLDVIIESRNIHLDKLILECSGLLE